MNAVHLVTDELTKSYTRGFTLGPLSLDISMGVTCLVGANGAGKSTFFRLASGVDRPTFGSIGLDGGSGRLGYLPQEPELPRGATCEEFLYYVSWLQRVPRSKRADAIRSALAHVGLEDRRFSKIGDLSGGMRRRLGIAHTLVHNPELILLDEPTVGLDPKQRVGLRETIANLSKERIVIVSTHLVEDVRGLATRVIVLNEGKIVYDGSVAGLEALADPNAPGDTDLERAIAGMMGAAV